MPNLELPLSLLPFNSKYGKLLRYQPVKVRRLQEIVRHQALMLKYRHDISIQCFYTGAISIIGNTVFGNTVFGDTGIGDTIRRGICDAAYGHFATLLI